MSDTLYPMTDDVTTGGGVKEPCRRWDEWTAGL